MSEEERRKIIIDQARMVNRQTECMGASLCLTVAKGKHISDEQADRFVAAAEALARVAAEIEKACW